MSTERLQKVMARAGLASRRACEEWITAGRVSVNGQVVTRLGTQVSPADVVAVDGKPLTPAASLVYVLLHKPAGYVTTAHDPEGRPTVMDLVHLGIRESGNQESAKPAIRNPQPKIRNPKFAIRNPQPAIRNPQSAIPNPRLFPVGRLDADSEGLLLLSNDGDLAYHLTHPRFALEKEYLALVQGIPPEAALRRLREGIDLDGRMTAKADVQIYKQPAIIANQTANQTWLRFVIHEGRQRQIRRICLVVGYPVQRLIRVRVGNLPLGNLPVGKWRYLTLAEVIKLKEL